MESVKEETPIPRESITFGGGCFWCVEAIFDDLKGVDLVESGYTGGHVTNPTYEQVCTGETGHAEAVQVAFDPQAITLKEILRIFFTVHDPTTLNRQGGDVGPQYRSAVFYRNDDQKAAAEEVIREIEAQKIWPASIVTTLEPFDTFYKAENYHQDYFARNGGQSYCQIVIAPKVTKFRKQFTEKLRK